MLRCVAGIPQWDPDAGGPAYVYMRVADHIAARIAAGDLPAEARLPAERDLAAEYAVAIGTARRAVLELRDRGLVVDTARQGHICRQPAPGHERSTVVTGTYVRVAHQFGSCRLLFALCATVLSIKRYSLCVASGIRRSAMDADGQLRRPGLVDRGH